MQIKYLKQGYKNNAEFYRDFCANDLCEYGDKYIEDKQKVSLPILADLPIYLAKLSADKKKELFLELIDVISKHFKDLNREDILNELFWHSYLCIYKRDFLINTYPSILESQKEFENIVTKDFDWENYLYKGILAFQYVDSQPVSQDEKRQYYLLILENFDMFNYIIKYEIFRNGDFLVNILRIISETGTAKILKARIKNRPDLGLDERYGRRVIYEFNKSYPMVLAPMLSKDQLKEYFWKFLGYYYNDDDVGDENIDDI